MTELQELRYQGRIAKLELALSEYMRVMEMTDYRVEGDLRDEFLKAYAYCLSALPNYRPAAPLGSSERRAS